MTLVIIFSLPQ
jgi:hypothetical protein